MMDWFVLSVLIYIGGGAWALATGDPRIAASVTTIAYVILLVAAR